MSIGSIRVPNEGPLNARIYLVGESPGADEIVERRPFVGLSGQLLRDCLGRNGITEDSVRFLNLCQFRPESNKFQALLRSRELAAGIEELFSDIRVGNPVVVAALGNWPLYYLTGRCGKKGPGTGIGKWRGSILPCLIEGLQHIKVIGTYHPAYIARNRAAYPIFDRDIQRIAADAEFREFRYPGRKLILDPRGSDLDKWTDILVASEYLSCDIESIKRSTRILCHSFSPHPGLSVVIAHSDTDFHRQSALAVIYGSKARKIFHNGTTFDIPMLKINRIEVENVYWDTQVAQHVMWGQLPKSLEYLTSVHTRQPYYKTVGRANIPEDAKGWSEKYDKNALYEYNGTDTSVTSEIQIEQFKEMLEGPPEWKKLFDHEMRLAKPVYTIGMTGMPIDLEVREKIKVELERRWALNQFVLDQLTGYKTNVNSTKLIPKILFDKDKFDLPPRRNRDGNLTADEDAIVSLIAHVKDKISKLKPGGAAVQYWERRYEALKLILVIRGIRKLLSSYINAPLSDDGWARSIYKITGTITGRLSCAQFFDKTGFNAQTMPREVLEIKQQVVAPELQPIIDLIWQQQKEDLEEAMKDDDDDGEDSDTLVGTGAEGSSFS